MYFVERTLTTIEYTILNLIPTNFIKSISKFGLTTNPIRSKI
jgi:hypothetical protein